MWVLPPIMGQKVVLDPSGANYRHYEARQARGTAGYITDVSNSADWHLWDERKIKQKQVGVTWENGHTNGYCLADLLPLDVFKDSGYIRFADGDQVDLSYKELDEYIDHKIIRQGMRITKEVKYDEAYRKKIYIALRNHINVVIEVGEINAHQSNIIGALSDMGYSFGNPEDKPSATFKASPHMHADTSILDGIRRPTVEAVTMTPELRQAMDDLMERHYVIERQADGTYRPDDYTVPDRPERWTDYHVADDDEQQQF